MTGSVGFPSPTACVSSFSGSRIHSSFYVKSHFLCWLFARNNCEC